MLVNRLLKLKIVFFFTVFSSSCYVSKQAMEHVRLLWTREPVVRVIADKSEDEKTRAKLVEVQRILSFAEKSGFAVGDAYQYFIDLERSAVSYVVQAAKPDEMELKTWWFPIVGSVPYLGFYDLDECRNKANDLKRLGYETSLSGVGAYSSLGWFSDPLFSSMIRRQRPSLVELILHELTHRTIWIAGSAQFNEQFAEFVGQQAAKKYLLENKDEKSLNYLHQRLSDEKLFSAWVVDLRASVEELIKSYKQGSLSEPAFLQRKNEIYIEYVKIKKPQFKVVDYIGTEPWNNASLLAAGLYNDPLPELAEAFRCFESRKLSSFFREVKKELNIIEKNPKKGLQYIIEKNRKHCP